MPVAPPPPKPASPILDIIDRMMAAPAAEKTTSAVATVNKHAGAASVGVPQPTSPVAEPRAELPKDGLDEAAELFKVIFKGEIIP